ncbi:hypothetical protein OB2597_06705 [Pseudooceanicola batsensis HTCC2597]|uniref:Thioredoxin-like fold domain-containing protein n=1 Tax=Pseudooceanicola batsensis (strain ATCC BAA-863 / DSM 15984 / KCTC 12145 / HTCC2597) TaxID=252305 RepID=A3TTH6_PSEBH|nr:thioredoxin domain-containing protein [Pseudooceanicola batsensis]EAQ04953.1 hypothetical protein OB2597_06705 [Pseudooceanicola batsensis HTCC2597]
MTRTLRSVLLSSALLIGTGASAQSTLPYPPVEPAIDTVIGLQESAENTLVAYLSPGCFSCLAFAYELTQAGLEEPLSDGRLYIIIRAVPTAMQAPTEEQGGDATRQSAMRHSINFALMSRCASHFEDDYAELQTWAAIYVAYLNLDTAEDREVWPYLSPERMQQVLDNLRSTYALNDDQVRACFQQGELRDNLMGVLQGYVAQSLELDPPGQVPAIFLNGERIEWNLANKASFLEALSDALGTG